MRDFGADDDERRGDGRAYDRLIALCFCGAVLFHPLLIGVFDLGPTETLLGVPALIVYLFVAWAGLIAMMRATVRRPGKPPRVGPRDGRRGGRSN
jgi:hypothetical protein